MVGNFESDHRFSWKGEENTPGRENWKADDGVGEEGEGQSKNSGSF
jgi:hypothetical protein